MEISLNHVQKWSSYSSSHRAPKELPDDFPQLLCRDRIILFLSSSARQKVVADGEGNRRSLQAELQQAALNLGRAFGAAGLSGTLTTVGVDAWDMMFNRLDLISRSGLYFLGSLDRFKLPNSSFKQQKNTFCPHLWLQETSKPFQELIFCRFSGSQSDGCGRKSSSRAGGEASREAQEEVQPTIDKTQALVYDITIIILYHILPYGTPYGCHMIVLFLTFVFW